MYKIAYVTSSRADYGIVRNFLKFLNNDNEIMLDILVTGSILDKKYGESYHIIEKDKLKIIKKVNIDLKDTDNISIINSMSIVLKEYGDFFNKNYYDLVIVLGDRYEMLSVAIAAAMSKLKILHIHGGEKTLANYDEFIRHCITKMSLYHFTSTDEYRNRVIQLGEQPENVFNIGAMGSENCKKIDLNNITNDILNLKNQKYFVVLFHPETLNNNPEEQIKILLSCIREFLNEYKFIFLGTNSDTGSDNIRNEINKFVNENKNAIYFENLHPDCYHYLLKNSIALIGNSSSGLIEAPTLGCYTINIGDRQSGRVRGDSVIDIKCSYEEIYNSIKNVYRKTKQDEFYNPYFKENSSQRAYEITKELLNRNDSIIKDFYDIKKI